MKPSVAFVNAIRFCRSISLRCFIRALFVLAEFSMIIGGNLLFSVQTGRRHGLRQVEEADSSWRFWSACGGGLALSEAFAGSGFGATFVAGECC